MGNLQVDCYDSLREIRILAIGTSGKQWVSLTKAVKRFIEIQERLLEVED